VAKNDMMPAGPMGDPMSGVTVNRKKEKITKGDVKLFAFSQK
jgi:hypothetical protein